MAEYSERLDRPSLLDRSIDLTVVSWAAIGWVIVMASAIAIRVFNLDVWALSPDEAHRAFDSWSLYRGGRRARAR